MSVKLKQKLKSVANLEKSISRILSSQKVFCQWGTTVSFVRSNILNAAENVDKTGDFLLHFGVWEIEAPLTKNNS